MAKKRRLRGLAIFDQRAEQGLCVRCGGSWIEMGVRIKAVDATPLDASNALRENLRKARIFLDKPICEDCESKIKRKPGGTYSATPLIKFETHTEAVMARGPLAFD